MPNHGTMSARSPGFSVSYCQVDAAGVPAEWVEATAAREGQPTIVYFLSASCCVGALDDSRLSAGELARATGARVLTVACLPEGEGIDAAAVERGIAAYAWLIGEGCNLDLTAFTHDPTGAPLMEAILVTARNDGLPLPTWGILSAPGRPGVPPTARRRRHWLRLVNGYVGLLRCLMRGRQGGLRGVPADDH